MLYTAYLAYAVALAIAAAIPGPGIAALTGRALATGFTRSMPMLAGLVLGDVTYLTLAVAGLALIANTFATAFLIIKFAGAAYLLWLAWNFWRHGLATRNVHKSSGRRDGLASFAAGFAVTMGNPKTIIFYMALLPTVIDLQSVAFRDWLLLASITVVVLYAVIIPYIALAARARDAMANRNAMRALSRTAAGAMAGAAGFILVRG